MRAEADASSGYICPLCAEPTGTSVRRTVASANEILRTRECPVGHRWHTREVAADHEFKVRKSTGKVVPFERAFVLEKSISLAGGGILTDRTASEIADRVVRRLHMSSDAPVESRAIGEAVIAELKQTSRLAALRYAAIFRSSREQVDVDEFLDWAGSEFNATPHLTASSRPAIVVKRAHPARNPGYSEDFQAAKLLRSFGIATRRLAVHLQGHRAITGTELAATLAAWVLQQVAGQPIVSSAQLSGAALTILRAVCPFGYVRYAAIAKSLSTTDAFLAELAALRESPSTHIDLTPFADEGTRLLSEGEHAGL